MNRKLEILIGIVIVLALVLFIGIGIFNTVFDSEAIIGKIADAIDNNDMDYLKRHIEVEGIKNDGTGTTETPYFSEKLYDNNTQNRINLTNDSITTNSFGFLGKNGRLTDIDGSLSSGPLIIKISNQYGDYGVTINDLGVIDNE